LLEVENLTYGILKGVSFAVKPCTIAGIVGENGAGKTTLLKCIAGMHPFKGSVRIEGVCVKVLPLKERIKIVNCVPQEINKKIDLSVRRFLEVSVPDSSEEKIEKALEEFEIKKLAERRFESLSGGEKIKVLLARLFLISPKVCMLDEPTSFLDLETTEKLKEFLIEMKNCGKIVLIVSHDIKFLEQICDVLIGLKQGSLIFHKTFKKEV